MFRPSFSFMLSVSGFMTIAACTRASAQSGTRDATAAVGGTSERLTDLAMAPLTRRVVGKSTIIDVEGQPSPDGSFITITDWTTGDLAAYYLGTATTTRLTKKGSWETSNEFAEASAISPDGKSIAYGWWSDAKKSFEMRLISLGGADSGKIRTIYTAPDLQYAAPQAWTPDGRNIVAAIQLNDRTSHIAIVPINGGSVRRLKSFDWRYPDDMAVSPDGRWVAYDFPPDEDNSARDVYVVAVDGSVERAVATGTSDDFVVGWTPDGSRLLFASDRGGTPAVWAATMQAGKTQGDPILVRSEMWRMVPLGTTRNGTFFYSVITGARDLYSAILDPKTGRVASKPTAIGGSPTMTIPFAVTWSPDGRQVATLLVRGNSLSLYGPADIVIRSLDRGEVRRISPKLSRLTRLYWSPDGRSFILRGNDLKGRPGIFRMDLQSGELKTLFENSQPNPGQMLSITGNGTMAYFMTRDSSFTQSLVNAINLVTGEIRVIHRVTMPSGIVGMAVNPDGKLLAINMRGGKYGTGVVTLLPVTGGTPKEIYRFSPSESLRSTPLGVAWTPNGQQILFGVLQTSNMGDKVDVRTLPVSGGVPHSIGIPLGPISALQVSPDGRRIAYGINDFSAELWTMEVPKFELARQAARITR
jgi:Tol biopolymer transport system component